MGRLIMKANDVVCSLLCVYLYIYYIHHRCQPICTQYAECVLYENNMLVTFRCMHITLSKHMYEIYNACMSIARRTCL